MPGGNDRGDCCSHGSTPGKSSGALHFYNHYAAHACSAVPNINVRAQRPGRQGQLDAEGRTLLAGRLLRYERRACHVRHRLCSREAGARLSQVQVTDRVSFPLLLTTLRRAGRQRRSLRLGLFRAALHAACAIHGPRQHEAASSAPLRQPVKREVHSANRLRTADRLGDRTNRMA